MKAPARRKAEIFPPWWIDRQEATADNWHLSHERGESNDRLSPGWPMFSKERKREGESKLLLSLESLSRPESDPLVDCRSMNKVYELWKNEERANREGFEMGKCPATEETSRSARRWPKWLFPSGQWRRRHLRPGRLTRMELGLVGGLLSRASCRSQSGLPFELKFFPEPCKMSKFWLYLPNTC